MKIVQTFWTANKSLLSNSFGWMNAQYHLMSWALSCLSLKEHYKDIVLYTDSNGYKVFAELLELPYKEVIVQYDNLPCPEPHWAYPKVLTYSLQKEPFIHVDGDVYLPKRLSHDVEVGGLIAQNLETGSDYYKNMMNDILRRGVLLPTFLKEELTKDSIGSYNAGILGGNDLDFIQEYCQAAFHIIESNYLNSFNNRKININNNLLFEQILFYALAKMRNKSVTTVFDHSVRDNGYTYEKFCNFYNYDSTKMMHILGGHKRNHRICELLGKTLLSKYPEYYKKVLNLFPQYHQRLQNQNTKLFSDLTIQMCIGAYQDHLHSLSNKWEKILIEDLFVLEKYLSIYPKFLNAERKVQDFTIITRNPYLSVFEIPEHWVPEAKYILKDRINKDSHLDKFDVAMVPCLLNAGLKEVLISDLGYNILISLEEKKAFDNLLKELLSGFSFKTEKEQVYKSVMGELEYLFYYGLIYVESF